MLRFAVFVLAAVSFAIPAAVAEEPYVEFLQGLRDRRYYDYVQHYLESLESDPNLPAEIRAVLPYERATSLLMETRAGAITNPEVQARQLDQALGFLDQFIKDSPQHPLAGEANTERARILLGKARVEVWQARSPANVQNRGQFQTAARDQIARARAIFQTAHSQHETAWKAFGPFIDMNDAPDQYKARQDAEVRFITAQLDLANCTYEEAQTHDKGSDGYKATLSKAATEYEAIHTRYRSQMGGLFARAWQGKCFEEQNDISRAIGIYKELLDHTPTPGSPLIGLQDQVRHFELICLNHESRKDYQLVISKAQTWLDAAKGRQKYSPVAVAIRWEQALAQETLSAQRETAEPDRNRLLRSALANVQTVKRFPGQYRDLATFKERDLMVKIKGDSSLSDPDNFDTAFSLAQELVTKKTKELQDRLKAAQASRKREDIDAAQADLNNHLADTVRMLRLALALADPKTPVNDLNLARYYLSYMHLLARDNYEAAILSGFIATHYGKENPVQAQDAAYMAMAAFVQAFNDNGKAKRKDDQLIDVAQMESFAQLLVEKWPTSDRAMDARIQMGTVLGQLDQYEQSAGWYAQIPDSATRYIEAQTRAGQAYWSAYAEAANPKVIPKPTTEQLDGWMSSAEQHLRQGIDGAEKATPATAPAPDTLIAAKASLVQILVTRGAYDDAVKVLTGAPHPVVEAIQVPDESKRPRESGNVKSTAFASLVYQLQLRCYVGLQQLDQARAAMQNLEKLGGGDGAALTEVYKNLGEELKKELERLKALGQQQQFQQVRTSFETFLKDMLNRKDQTVGSLTWIAETYYNLALSSSEDPAATAAYYNNAATAYQAILDKARETPGFIDPGRLTGVRLRLVNCRRSQGEFDQALALVRQILAENVNYLDAQIEACLVYQTAGETGQADAAAQFQKAINGDSAAKVWGWAQTARRLQLLLQTGDADAKQRYEDRHYEARYNGTLCRLGIASSLSGAKKDAELENARSEIIAFVTITSGFDDDWWPKFDDLYQRVQQSMGRIPEPLERPKEYTPPPVTRAVAGTGKSQKKATKTATNVPVTEPSGGGSGMAYALLGLAALLGLGGGGFMVIRGTKKKRPSPLLSSPPPENLVIAPPPSAPARKKRAPDQPAAAEDTAAPAAAPRARRPMTPEEKERAMRQRAAQARQPRKKESDPSDQPPSGGQSDQGP